MQSFIDMNMATLQKYFVIEGTATRRQFWYFILFTWFIDIGASILDILTPGNLLQNVASALLFIPTLTVGVRRMHDTDHSGWWLLFPIYNIVLLLTRTTPNRWNKGLEDIDWKG